MTLFATPQSIQSKGRLLSLQRPLVMGILNTTPDSFHAESRVANSKDVVLRAGQMLEAGADILDIGGYSSRPGADDVPVQEELERVLPAIEAIKAAYPDSWVSVDTFRAKVAEKAVDAGADIVNDIGGGQLDAALFETVAALGVPYILMHMRGNPQTMQSLTDYEDVVEELLDYFLKRIELAEAAGIKDIWVDPGIGFAKTAEQSFELIRRLHELTFLSKPILIGLSRKSFIYKSLGIHADTALNGTTALHMVALGNGAQILRVHDVVEAHQCVALFDKIQYKAS